MLDNFFNPKSVAVIGASSDPQKVGFALVSNLIKSDLLAGGRIIYPITLKEKAILGIPAFASILDVPEHVDLAIIAVRADIVPQVLTDCGKKQIPNVIIISSGFKEAGEIGKGLEDEVAKIAREKNIALLGPNCLGVIDTKNNLNASFAVQKPLPGKIALLSQSGALGTAMLDWAKSEGVGFSKFISLGNEAQLTEIDFLKYLKDDEDTDSILIYLEKVSGGKMFMDLVSEITKTKPVVIIKAGVSSRGLKAVMSHTGSLAPESSVFSGACRQAGAITVSSLREFFNLAKLLSLGIDIKKPVQNLVILTNGGGPSVVATDLVENSNYLSLVELSENTKEELKKVLPSMSAVGNPIDIIGDALAERYEKALDILCEISETDGIIVMLTPQMMTEAEATAKVLGKYKDKKKIFPVFMGGDSINVGRKALVEAGLVNFNFPKDLVEALDDMANGAPKFSFPRTSLEKLPQRGVLEEISLSQMPFNDMSKILADYGIFISGKFLNRKEDLENALGECGEGPYVMKAISPNIVHKTDLSAVKLNIKNLDEASVVWEELWQVIASVRPSHEASDVAKAMTDKMVGEESILVQKMEMGREVIIGMKRDNTFGPTILFGLGGILAEAIKDTTIRIAPLEKTEALKMMQEIKGIKILQGMRGELPVNFDLLADIIVKLSLLSIDHPEIKEIDLNPVMATDTSATIVDARIII